MCEREREEGGKRHMAKEQRWLQGQQAKQVCAVCIPCYDVGGSGGTMCRYADAHHLAPSAHKHTCYTHTQHTHTHTHIHTHTHTQAAETAAFEAKLEEMRMQLLEVMAVEVRQRISAKRIARAWLAFRRGPAHEQRLQHVAVLQAAWRSLCARRAFKQTWRQHQCRQELEAAARRGTLQALQEAATQAQSIGEPTPKWRAQPACLGIPI